VELGRIEHCGLGSRTLTHSQSIVPPLLARSRFLPHDPFVNVFPQIPDRTKWHRTARRVVNVITGARPVRKISTPFGDFSEHLPELPIFQQSSSPHPKHKGHDPFLVRDLDAGSL
jgi:hypothetical protein